jgi:hypothetical protein
MTRFKVTEQFPVKLQAPNGPILAQAGHRRQ